MESGSRVQITSNGKKSGLGSFQVAIPVQRLTFSALAMLFLNPMASTAYAASDLTFKGACDAGEQLIIAGIGDVLAHRPLQEQAYSDRDGFKSLWSEVIPWIEKADIAYGNLEGPAAEGLKLGGENMVFNYHPRIVTDLKESGFDILSVANNHALDRGSKGIDLTIQAFEKNDMPYLGIKTSSSARQSWAKIVQKNGWNIAFLACSDVFNSANNGQVLNCSSDKTEIVNEIRSLRSNNNIDAIILTPHWGVEYVTEPNARQKSLARSFVEAGVDAIIGAHPHVMQTVEKISVRDSNGNIVREALVAYSLGNFISNQSARVGQRLTAVLYVGLTRKPGQRAYVNGVSYLPLWLERPKDSPTRGFNLAPLETTRVSQRSAAYSLLRTLVDGNRELRVDSQIRTTLECR